MTYFSVEGNSQMLVLMLFTISHIICHQFRYFCNCVGAHVDSNFKHKLATFSSYMSSLCFFSFIVLCCLVLFILWKIKLSTFLRAQLPQHQNNPNSKNIFTKYFLLVLDLSYFNIMFLFFVHPPLAVYTSELLSSVQITVYNA